MNASELGNRFREQFGIRLEGASSQYLHQQLNERPDASVPVMGSDAKTGVAIRRIVDLGEIGDAARR